MWRILSFNSFDLNSATYSAALLDDDNASILPTVNAVLVKLGENAPDLDSIERDVDHVVVQVRILAANWRTPYKNLVGAFSTLPNETAPLVILGDDGEEWTVQAKPLVMTKDTATRTFSYKIKMLVPDKVWRKAATPIAWNVSSSPATQTVTNDGNSKSYPVITWTPTLQKTSGHQYRHWLAVRNPGDMVFNNWGLNLTGNGLDTTGWVADASNSVQINNGAGIDASQTTIPYDTVTGSIPSFGMGYVGTEQIAWTGRTGTTSGNLTGVTRGIGGTTAATHADNAVIKLSYMLANGADLRVYKNGQEDNLWISAPNAAATKMWITADLSPRIEFTLRTAVAASGDIDSLEFTKSYTGKQFFQDLPNEGTLLIGSEAFTYYGKDDRRLSVDVVERHAKDTSEAAHAIDDAVYWIEHDYWLYSGNPSATAQVTDDTNKPVIDLAASTNLSRVYYLFGDSTGLRANSWNYVVERTNNPEPPDGQGSRTYTGNHTDETADPFTEAGVRMAAVQLDRWFSESGALYVSSHEPAGIYSANCNGEKNKTGTGWPRYVRIEKSKSTRLEQNKGAQFWGNVYAITVPTGSWQAVASGVQVFGDGYYDIRLRMEGTVMGGANYEAAVELNDVTIVTVLPPVVTIGTRHLSTYEADFTLENAANGHVFAIRTTVAIDESLVIDCAAKTITYSADGQERRSALIKDSAQTPFMVFEGGDNDLTYTETGVTGATLDIAYDHMLVL